MDLNYQTPLFDPNANLAKSLHYSLRPKPFFGPGRCGLFWLKAGVYIPSSSPPALNMRIGDLVASVVFPLLPPPFITLSSQSGSNTLNSTPVVSSTMKYFRCICGITTCNKQRIQLLSRGQRACSFRIILADHFRKLENQLIPQLTTEIFSILMKLEARAESGDADKTYHLEVDGPFVVSEVVELVVVHAGVTIHHCLPIQSTHFTIVKHIEC